MTIRIGVRLSAWLAASNCGCKPVSRRLDMGIFAYTALDASRTHDRDDPRRHARQAMDMSSAAGFLRSRWMSRRRRCSRSKQSTSTRVSQAAVESFTRELANLLAAGLPLSRALQLLQTRGFNAGRQERLERDSRRRRRRQVAGRCAGQMAEGLFHGLRRDGARRRIGRVSGDRAPADRRLPHPRTGSEGQGQGGTGLSVRAGVFAIVVVTFLLTFFIPKFQGVFKEFGGKLPAAHADDRRRSAT